MSKVGKRQRIQRLIRDLDIRYIKGSIDRRTYQILKTKYQNMLKELPMEGVLNKEANRILIGTDNLEQMEVDLEQGKATSPQIIEPTISLPNMAIKTIPEIAMKELKIRYVMNLAILSASNLLQQELQIDQEFTDNKKTNSAYLEEKKKLEKKEKIIFDKYYALSDLLSNITVDHIYKKTHNNFLLFNNELSENLNRLRRGEIEREEIKGIIYEINNRVLRHRPLLKKAIEDTKKWKIAVNDKIEVLNRFKEENQKSLVQNQLEGLERRIRQFKIFEELLEEDINDYIIDLEAIDEIYGEHLRFQDISSRYFADLSDDTEARIRRYCEVVRSIAFLPNLEVIASSFSTNIDYTLMKELKRIWDYNGRSVINTDNELIGFMVGPGKSGDDYGFIIRKQQEISSSLLRRTYDHVIAPIIQSTRAMSEEDKRTSLLNEFPRVLPHISHAFLIPDNIIDYCKSIGANLSSELEDLLRQPIQFLFVPIEDIIERSRNIVIKTQNIRELGLLLPFFDPKASHEFRVFIEENEHIEVEDIFGKKIGEAHSILYHPKEGYFLVVEREVLPDRFFAMVYDLLYVDQEDSHKHFNLSFREKKWHLLFKLSREYKIMETKVEDPEFLKQILVQKNAGILPHDVEHAKYALYSIGTLKIVGDDIKVGYGSPSFDLIEVFDIEGKIVENVKGEDIGVVHTLNLEPEPVVSIWTKINLLKIASFISDEPAKVLKEDKYFLDNLAISIGKKLSLIPQAALYPENVLTFMNLIGKISQMKEIEELLKDFNPAKIELPRIISIDDSSLLVDLSIQDIKDQEEQETETEQVEEQEFVTSPATLLNKKRE